MRAGGVIVSEPAAVPDSGFGRAKMSFGGRDHGLCQEGQRLLDLPAAPAR